VSEVVSDKSFAALAPTSSTGATHRAGQNLSKIKITSPKLRRAKGEAGNARSSGKARKKNCKAAGKSPKS
jgi:hypothetical protein